MLSLLVGIIRVVTILAGGASIVWGASEVADFARYSALEDSTIRILAGEPFGSNALEQVGPLADSTQTHGFCNPEALHAAAIVRLRLLEQALWEGQGSALDQRFASVEEWTRQALACSPADPYLWLVLYRTAVEQNGYKPRDVTYLKMSYALGRNEGWIAVKRNGFALAVFDRLPANLQARVVAEFAKLLNSGFEREAIAILTGPGWKVRDRLLVGLGNVKIDFRQDLAIALYHDGYDIAVPGVKLPDPRPWD